MDHYRHNFTFWNSAGGDGNMQVYYIEAELWMIRQHFAIVQNFKKACSEFYILYTWEEDKCFQFD